MIYAERRAVLAQEGLPERIRGTIDEVIRAQVTAPAGQRLNTAITAYITLRARFPDCLAGGRSGMRMPIRYCSQRRCRWRVTTNGGRAGSQDSAPQRGQRSRCARGSASRIVPGPQLMQKTSSGDFTGWLMQAQ
jgi:hypothetical protein